MGIDSSTVTLDVVGKNQPGPHRRLLHCLGREQRPGMISSPLPRTWTPPSAQDNRNIVPHSVQDGRPPPAKAPDIPLSMEGRGENERC